MRNAGLEDAQAGIKIAGRNINNLRYPNDTTPMAESEEELKSLLMKVKVEHTHPRTHTHCVVLCLAGSPGLCLCRHAHTHVAHTPPRGTNRLVQCDVYLSYSSDSVNFLQK